MGHYNITKLLLENQADLKLTNYKGQTAVNQAEEKGYSEIVNLLSSTRTLNS